MDSADADWYLGRNVLDRSGRIIGSISQVFMDDRAGGVDWISVSTGLFGPRDNYAPLVGSRIQGDDVVLPIDREVVKGSPNSVTTDHLTDEELAALTTYYQAVLAMTDGEHWIVDPPEPSRASPSTSVEPGAPRSARD
jgi:sporulation protein YlmC with PRC-barrel domain